MRKSIPIIYLGYDAVTLCEICDADGENGMELKEFDEFTRLIAVKTSDGLTTLRMFGSEERQVTLNKGETAVIVAENELFSPDEVLYIDFEGNTDGVKVFAVCG
ncbi:MAG: hypothetical protein E7491_06550 [Ruminococcaceae bacterium]|nr:hypothetical protein [Oscillospiraceae bacterium]